MKAFILFFLGSVLLASCTSDNSKTKELELKEKELALKEREISLKEKLVNDEALRSSEPPLEVNYKSHTPCTFSVSLPSSFKMRTMFDDRSPDFCDYLVSTDDGLEVIELHSLLNSRFEFTEIQKLYNAALLSSELQITYKIQKANWFVISGTNKENGHIVYWKRISGENFISDLRFEYPINRKSEIDPYIGRISNSFKSE